MNMRALCIAAVIVLVVCGLGYAGEMMREEGLQRFNEGVKAQQGGDHQVALAAYQKSYLILYSNKAKESIYPLINAGVIYASNGDLAQAEQMFKTALSIDAGNKEANCNLGFLYAKQGFLQEAWKYLVRAVAKSEDYISVGEQPLDRVPGK